MTIEELRKQKAEIDKQIRAMKYEKQFGRVRLTKDTYKKCHRGWDLAIKFSDVHNDGMGDKWRNVISTSDKADILPYIIQLQADLSMMRKELEVNADGDSD